MMGDSLAVNGVVRRHRSLEEKLEILEQTREPGASVARIAQQHGINANLIFNWRRQHLRGVLGAPRANSSSLLKVRVSEGSADAIASAIPTGTIHIKFGKARIRIEGKADAQALSVVLERLLR
jgi:transposase